MVLNDGYANPAARLGERREVPQAEARQEERQEEQQEERQPEEPEPPPKGRRWRRS